MPPPSPSVTGLVLAAGAGTRMGMPKALVRTDDGTPWVDLAVTFLRASGCERIVVVVGARADEAAALVPATAEVVIANDWAEGMSASLRAGLAAASGVAVLVTLVDLPAMPVAVGERVLRGGPADAGVTRQTLRQAVFSGRPGHPVVIGADHWRAVAASITGDRGARSYLASHAAREVECADLFDGRDVDS